MNGKTFHFERGIEIHLVQTQQRKQGGEGPRATDAVSLKIAREQPGGKATCPFVKVAQYNADTMKFRIVQDLWAYQLSSLLAAFKETRAQVQIKTCRVVSSSMSARKQPRRSRHGVVMSWLSMASRGKRLSNRLPYPPPL